MKGKTRTKPQQRRFELAQDAGCVPCWLEAKLQDREYIPEPPDMHHVDQSDHWLTYANCPWHHRGVPKPTITEGDMRRIFGPSMAKQPERYRARYGSEDDMLRFQLTMIKQYCEKWGLKW